MFQYVVIVGLLVILELAGVVLFFIINDEVSLLSNMCLLWSMKTKIAMKKSYGIYAYYAV